MNITKKQTHREQTSGQQCREGWQRGNKEVGNEEIQTTVHKMNKKQEHIVQHREILPIFYGNYKWSITFKNCEPTSMLST